MPYMGPNVSLPCLQEPAEWRNPSGKLKGSEETSHWSNKKLCLTEVTTEGSPCKYIVHVIIHWQGSEYGEITFPIQDSLILFVGNKNSIGPKGKVL
jgi:hypothetical protein